MADLCFGGLSGRSRYMAKNAPIHDWDQTLKAALSLLEEGHSLDEMPKSGDISQGFPHFTASMLLSLSAIESFSDSVAHVMADHKRFKKFKYKAYRKTAPLWGRLELLLEAIPFEIDRSAELFKTLQEMQDWRNLVAHVTPSKNALAGKSYAVFSGLENAKKFYNAASNYVGLVLSLTEIEPKSLVLAAN
jgi:hypothetical protein